jgi:hypothetical protein
LVGKTIDLRNGKRGDRRGKREGEKRREGKKIKGSYVRGFFHLRSGFCADSSQNDGIRENETVSGEKREGKKGGEKEKREKEVT